MRTALLAAMKRTGDGLLRAHLSLAGRSVLGWQIDLAKRLGCERIVCVSEAPDPEMLTLQQETEALGLEFHFVRGVSQFVVLLRSGDDLFVIQDGLVLDPEFAASLIGTGNSMAKGVFASDPAEEMVASHPDDFERIDAGRSWAGVLAMDAGAAQRLTDSPADCDPISMLLRIALQSGVPSIDMGHSNFRDRNILLASSPETLSRHQKRVIARHAETLEWTGPLRACALKVGSHPEFGPSNRGIWVSGGIGSSLLVLGTFLAFSGFGAAGLGISAVGSLAGSAAVSSFNLRRSLFKQARASVFPNALKNLMEIIPPLAVIGALAPTLERVEVLVLPILVFGLVALAARDGSAKSRAFWSDRPLQLTVLAIASLWGALPEALSLLGLGALGHKLLRLRTN